MAAYRIMGDHVNGNSIELAYEYDLKRAMEKYEACVKGDIKNVKLLDVSGGRSKEINVNVVNNKSKSNGGASAILMIIALIPAIFLISVGGWFLGGLSYLLIGGSILLLTSK